ncbi:hypothetical protein V5799_017098 [Amblyomma americanum]|uniref:Uncharacterized protein n=1 Tax=Amblyomma americanum TaxID=6943 RepID=A0AAQ4F3S3_AMBAM
MLVQYNPGGTTPFEAQDRLLAKLATTPRWLLRRAVICWESTSRGESTLRPRCCAALKIESCASRPRDLTPSRHDLEVPVQLKFRPHAPLPPWAPTKSSMELTSTCGHPPPKQRVRLTAAAAVQQTRPVIAHRIGTL